MSQTVTLKKGLDLRIEGAVSPQAPVAQLSAELYALVPDDFPGFTPKPEVHEGDTIVAGAPLFRDKNNPDIKLASPVSGTVERIARGERRKILYISVKVDHSSTATATFAADPKNAEEAAQLLKQSGLWAMMRQRPYAIVPQPGATPRDIFITAFDSAPLAPSLLDAVKGCEKEIEEGVRVLSLLTSGHIYISLPANAADVVLPSVAEKVIVKGPHPAGNAGVQAANIAPVSKGETIWTLDIVTLARIGRLSLTGKPDWTTTVAVTGPEAKEPRLVKTYCGVQLAPVVTDNFKTNEVNHRVISGNILTGHKESLEGWLRYPYRQVTLMREGDDTNEFMGWASLAPSKMSQSRSFPSRLMPWRKFSPDARINGSPRAMILSGLYDKMLPMDILPEYLIKAILAGDIDRMEQLGIYEVAPEDFALCEYIDPSKLKLQEIVAHGLANLRKELE